MNRYTRESLIEEIKRGQTFEYLLFCGHKASSDGSVSDSCCSQWFPAKFQIDGVEYSTAEHYMMAEKARLFKDEEMLEQILHSATPREAKALGRKVQHFEDSVWKKHGCEIVVKANRAKFLQNPEFAKWLLATAPKVLVEASPFDRIWGIGMAKSNTEAKEPSKWKGQNLLGFALMEVREILQDEASPEEVRN
jgi:ribA/ribD-fused uncharacterized protein